MEIIYTKHARQRMKQRKVKRTIVSSMVKKQKKISFQNDFSAIFEDGSIKVVTKKLKGKIIVITIIRKNYKILDKFCQYVIL
tara:strand:+ start:347 stop:592 length:246 start_codon:yes stop_codon:yes gene_type:complete